MSALSAQYLYFDKNDCKQTAPPPPRVARCCKESGQDLNFKQLACDTLFAVWLPGLKRALTCALFFFFLAFCLFSAGPPTPTGWVARPLEAPTMSASVPRTKRITASTKSAASTLRRVFSPRCLFLSFCLLSVSLHSSAHFKSTAAGCRFRIPNVCARTHPRTHAFIWAHAHTTHPLLCATQS